MQTPLIQYINERKANWLQSKQKNHKTPEAQADDEQEANTKFSPANWISNAAKRASQLTISSHVPKFTHPDARAVMPITECQPANDGYLRTGNISYNNDVFGNAAALDVYKFLNLQLQDGQTLLQHLEQNTPEAQQALDFPGLDYTQARDGLLAMVNTQNKQAKTDARIKQVYFPLADGSYHLLSLVTPSGLLTLCKQRIDNIRFGETTKQAREAHSKGLPHDTGYQSLNNLTVTAYGGTKAQNISQLNSQNGGRAYLLPCFPPTIDKREIRLPTKNFFGQSLQISKIYKPLQNLHYALVTKKNNINIRELRDEYLGEIIDWVLQQALFIRQNPQLFSKGWSKTDHFSELPSYQAIFLDDAYAKERKQDDEWLQKFGRDLGRWILSIYKNKYWRNPDKHFTKADIKHVAKLTHEKISQHINEHKYFLQ